MTQRKSRGRGKAPRQTGSEPQTVPSREGIFETSLDFPVVGVGASAGGLEAFTQLLQAVPADTGMGFVLIQHLAPSHPSSLAEILSRSTRLPVTEGKNESPVLPNHIYVIPPGCDMIILRLPAQIFATDLNEASIQKARTGANPKYAAQDISAERLHRFFYEVDGNYRITKSIREICVFSKHNVLADPPFARIDLISCRNLLIYLQPALQQYLYALNPGGFLWLGASETIGSFRDSFDVKDSKYKIYVKRPGSAGTGVRLKRPSVVRAESEPIEITPRVSDRTQLYREGDRILLARYAPPSVLISSSRSGKKISK